jgi:hypothetical protein
MPKSCIICKVEASPDVLLQYCDACNSALYCSKACQRKDWKEHQHKQLCKLINVGHGDRQIRCDRHTDALKARQDFFELVQGSLDEEMKGFFKLFQESTFEGSQDAAREMKKIVERQAEEHQRLLLFHSLYLLVHTNPSEMLSWPNSPLLVLLEFIDSNVLSGDDYDFEDEAVSLEELNQVRETPLCHLVSLADSSDYCTHVNQLILAKQLIEHGANVNALMIPYDMTPLHWACSSGTVTNLDIIELLLVEGADPNAQDRNGTTVLILTVEVSPGAAKFLLNWPTTDSNITETSGPSFLDMVEKILKVFSDEIAIPGSPTLIKDQFLLQQWLEIKEMLVERVPET